MAADVWGDCAGDADGVKGGNWKSEDEGLGSGKFGELKMKIWARVKALLKRKQLEKDLDDELAFHLEMREAKKRAEGFAAEEAKYAARRQFGNATRMKEMCREMWSFASLETSMA